MNANEILAYLKNLRGTTGCHITDTGVTCTYSKAHLYPVLVDCHHDEFHGWSARTQGMVEGFSSLHEMAEILPGLLRRATVNITLERISTRIKTCSVNHLLPSPDGMEAHMHLRKGPTDKRYVVVGAAYAGQRFWVRIAGQQWQVNTPLAGAIDTFPAVGFD